MKLLFEPAKALYPDGLVYKPDYIPAAEEAALIKGIEAQPWLSDLKRRVQHHGYRYDYRAREVRRDSYIGPLPEWAARLCQRLGAEKIFSAIPDQVIVNEYLPGQGISAHVDCVPCFGDTIASLSLGSSCVMEFSHPLSREIRNFFLEPRSLIVLSGKARYEWRHAIPARKSDVIGGIKTPRQRRISLTFRNVLTS